MNAYIYFFEDYIELIFDVLKGMKELSSEDIIFHGLAARREKICTRLSQSDLDISSYDWLNELELSWLNRNTSEDEIRYYEDKLGTQKLRHLIYCDRELGNGFIFGGIYPKTHLREIVEKEPHKRWNYVIGMLDYFFKKFSNEKIDFVFFWEFTMSYELAAYYVAEALSIPAFCLRYTRFDDLIFVQDNPFSYDLELNKLYENKIDTLNLENANQYLKSFRDKPNQPIYSQVLNKKSQGWGILKNLIIDFNKLLGKWKNLLGNLCEGPGHLRQRTSRAAIKDIFYTFFEKLKVKYHFEKFDLSCKRYLYFPLHVEPESSTFILSPKITNQLFVIEQIAKCMPAGYKLLVKEHLPCLGYRPKGFYEKIKNIPDVHLISPNANNFQIIQNSQLVVVISGTAAWESILLGGKALVLGQTEFNVMEGQGLVLSNDLINFEEVIQEALDVSTANEESLIKLMGAAYQLGHRINYSTLMYAHHGVDYKDLATNEDKEALKSIAKKILMMTEKASGRV